MFQTLTAASTIQPLSVMKHHVITWIYHFICKCHNILGTCLPVRLLAMSPHWPLVANKGEDDYRLLTTHDLTWWTGWQRDGGRDTSFWPEVWHLDRLLLFAGYSQKQRRSKPEAAALQSQLLSPSSPLIFLFISKVCWIQEGRGGKRRTSNKALKLKHNICRCNNYLSYRKPLEQFLFCVGKVCRNLLLWSDDHHHRLDCHLLLRVWSVRESGACTVARDLCLFRS